MFSHTLSFTLANEEKTRRCREKARVSRWPLAQKYGNELLWDVFTFPANILNFKYSSYCPQHFKACILLCKLFKRLITRQVWTSMPKWWSLRRSLKLERLYLAWKCSSRWLSNWESNTSSNTGEKINNWELFKNKINLTSDSRSHDSRKKWLSLLHISFFFGWVCS